MDALSALRVAMPAQSGAGVVSGEAIVPRQIPAPELQQLSLTQPLPEAGKTASPAGFEDFLGRMVGEVNTRQSVAADRVQGLLGGQDVSLHETMIAMEEANLSFQLMVEVRNKLLESYQELMRMQV